MLQVNGASIINLYRVPIIGSGVFGFNSMSLVMHAIDCAQSDDKTLT